MNDERLTKFIDKINSTDKFIIYCAGEFASLVVQFCIENKLRDKIECCAVTEFEPYDSKHLLGVPVMEYAEIEGKDKLIVVAMLNEKIRGEICDRLRNDEFKNVYPMSKDEYNALKENTFDFSIRASWQLENIRKQNNHKLDNYFNYFNQQIQRSFEQMAHITALVQDNILLTHSMNLVSETHKQTFGKYKDINKGKTVVVCGTGSSLNKYKFNPDFIHIGTNAMLFQDRIKLDYFFCQHIPQSDDFPGGEAHGASSEARKKYLDGFDKLKCVKFIGQLLGELIYTSPSFGEVSNGNYGMYFISEIDNAQENCPDIRFSLLRGGSIILPALQFALFTNPTRIYIIGCDGYANSNNNYYNKEANDCFNNSVFTNKEQILSNSIPFLAEKHQKLKTFADMSYPNTEIIMVNPAHIKGIYKETVTDGDGNIEEVRND